MYEVFLLWDCGSWRKKGHFTGTFMYLSFYILYTLANLCAVGITVGVHVSSAGCKKITQAELQLNALV